MKNRLSIILFIILLLSSSSFAQTDAEQPRAGSPNREQVFSETQKIQGRVVGVHDGDTCTVLDANKRQHKIRFNGIDAPELKQDFGNRAKQNLSDLIFGKDVTVLFDKTDKYGRTVGTVFVNGIDANLQQIKAGMAWHYKKYQDEQSEEDREKYAVAEDQAREAKVGIWSQANIQPPWDYRGEKKAEQELARHNRQYHTGAKGGCYYINTSGKKTYVEKQLCINLKSEDFEKIRDASSGASSAVPATRGGAPAGRKYVKGPKGGCFYINSSGKKTYVDKEKCGQ